MDQREDSERTTVRVAVYFPIRYRVADDFEHLSTLITRHRTSDRFSAPPTAFTDLPSDLTELTEFQETSPHLYRMWMSMERKIDHLVWLLSRESFEDPAMKDAVCLDLSAGGALIQTGEKPEQGAHLLLRLTPPTFPVFILETVGKVITGGHSAQEEGKWLSNIEFTAINKSDQEDLITYIFKRQREILRDSAD